MNQHWPKSAILLAFVAAGPFTKLYLERHGVSTWLAWLGGFAMLGVGVLVYRLMRGSAASDS